MKTAGILLAGLIVVIVIVSMISSMQFQKKILLETERLLSQQTYDASIITPDRLEGLPEPVRKWLENSGIIGKENIHQVFLRQKGLMRMQPDQEKWIPSEAVQYFITEKPGFIWSVKMSMMGVPITGRDRFIDGRGEMLIKAAGTITLADAGNEPTMNQATLQRYLGEIVWFPSAALQPYITWQEIDGSSAKATMTIGETSGSAVFHFTEDGDLDKFIAWRYKEASDPEPTEWVATVNKTEEVQGIRIPTELEAAWINEEGPFTWYIFEIYDVRYNNIS